MSKRINFNYLSCVIADVRKGNASCISVKTEVASSRTHRAIIIIKSTATTLIPRAKATFLTSGKKYPIYGNEKKIAAGITPKEIKVTMERRIKRTIKFLNLYIRI